MADEFWKNLEGDFKAPAKSAMPPNLIEDSLKGASRFAISPALAPKNTNVPITPSLVQPAPPEGSFKPSTNSGLESLNELEEYDRQQKTETTRRGLESSKLQELRNKELETAAEHGGAAIKTKQLLNILGKLEELPETKNIHTGPLAEPWLKMMQAVKGSLPESFGSAELFPKDQAISSAEALQKLGIILSTASTKELTSRPAVFEFMKNIESNPGLMIRPETRKILTGILNKQADRDIELGKHALRSKDYFEFVKHQDRINSSPEYQYDFPEEMKTTKEDETNLKKRHKEIAPGIRERIQ